MPDKMIISFMTSKKMLDDIRKAQQKLGCHNLSDTMRIITREQLKIVLGDE